MSATPVLSRPSSIPARNGAHRRSPHVRQSGDTATPGWLARIGVQTTDALLPLSLILWLAGVQATQPEAMNDYGLLPALPVVFFLSVGLLAVSISLLLVQPRLSSVRLTLHLIALVVVLHGTVPLLFSEPNFPWVYKHIGVVRYIDQNGRLDTNVDIYHNWPGFFALGAWFTRIAGARSPLAYAAWAQIYFNLLTCLELVFAFRWLPVSRRVRWLALFLFVATNWVGQDYFAPQALAFVLSLAAFGMVLAWFQVDRPPALVKAARRMAARFVSSREETSIEEDGSQGQLPSAIPPRIMTVGVLFAVFTVIVVTHQLTPYVIVLGVGLLTVAGLVRPRWVVGGLAAVSLAYLLLRLPYIERTQDLLGSLGDPLNNIHNSTPNDSVPMVGRRLTALAAPALILGMWMLGMLGIVRRLRSGRAALVIALLAASPGLIALGQSYGGEAVFRIYLFSLPWVAVLAAAAVDPRPGRSWVWPAAKIGLVLSVALGLFISAFYGAEELYRVRPGEVAASQHFYDTAEADSVLTLAAPNFPTRVSARYDQFRSAGDNLPDLLTTVTQFRHRMLGADDLPAIAEFVDEYATGAAAPGGRYLVLSASQAVYSEVLGLLPPGSLSSLDKALAASPEWAVFYRNPDAVIYRLISSRIQQAGAAAPDVQAIPAVAPGSKDRSRDPVAVGVGVLGMTGIVVAWRRRRRRADDETHSLPRDEGMRMPSAAATNGRTPDAFDQELEALSEELEALPEELEPEGPVPLGEELDPHAPAPSVAVGEIDHLLRQALLASAPDRLASRVALFSKEPELSRFGELVAAADLTHRPEAVSILAGAWGPIPLAHIQPLLDDPAGPVRAAAVAALEPSAKAVVELRQRLRDDLSSSVRVAAIRALAAAPEDDQLWALTAGLADPEPEVRAAALQVLPVAVAARATRSVVAAGEDDDEQVRKAAYRRIATAEPWIRWIAIERSSRRAELCAVLRQRDPDGLAALVLERASSPDSGDRMLAMEMGVLLDAPGWVEDSVQALRDPEVALRRAAVRMLRTRPEAVPAIIAALQNDPDPVVRTEAARTLQSTKVDGALLAFIGALQDPEEEVRLAALDALVRNSSAGLAGRVADHLNLGNISTVGEVLLRMGRIGEDALLAVAVQGPSRRALAAAVLLKRTGKVETLVGALKNVDPTTRLAAVEVLGGLGGPEARQGLIASLSDAWPRIRSRAAFHLGQMGDKEAGEPLLRASRCEQVPEVLESIAEAVRQIGARAWATGSSSVSSAATRPPMPGPPGAVTKSR